MTALSPQQLTCLLESDWQDRDGVLCLNENLTLDDVKSAPFLTNVRILLMGMNGAEGIKATKAGNLNRAFVGEMLDALSLPPEYRATIKAVNKVIDEEDVWLLHLVRVVSELAGLISLVKSKFLVTKQGSDLIADDQVGVLHALLFRTYFRELNLAYVDRFPELPHMQETIAYSLFMTSELMGEWAKMVDIAESLFLPEVLSVIEGEIGGERIPQLAYHRLLRPLMNFGLVQERGNTGYGLDLVEAKKTELFDRFIRFELGSGLRLV